MKLMTLNTHSLVEPEYDRKLLLAVDVIAKEQPDVLAMQEVSQTADAAVMKEADLAGYIPHGETACEIRENNHAANVARLLREKGCPYFWTWIPIKLGYGKYDEGISIFSRTPIRAVDAFRISRSSEYTCWKTRKVIGIQTGSAGDWFYSVHMGWWDDADEPFPGQWETLKNRALEKQNDRNRIWLMGDFNSPSQTREQGYDRIVGDGFQDTYRMAEQKDSGITVEEAIDGWKERMPEEGETEVSGMRMDHIFCSREASVLSSNVVCNGKRGPVVSDHYGVIAEIKEEF